MPPSKNNAFIITGKINSGKTGLIKESLPLIIQSGIKCGGIISEGIFDGKMKKGFNLVNAASGEKMLLCTDLFNKDWNNLGRFYFNPATIQYGLNVLSPEILYKYDVVVIDEIGPLELSGRGWAPALERLAVYKDKLFLVAVREGLTQQVIEKFNFHPLAEFIAGRHTAGTLAARVMEHFNKPPGDF